MHETYVRPQAVETGDAGGTSRIRSGLCHNFLSGPQVGVLTSSATVLVVRLTPSRWTAGSLHSGGDNIKLVVAWRPQDAMRLGP